MREAPVGIEPTNRGFADLCLTTWLRRRRNRKLASRYGFGKGSDFDPAHPNPRGNNGGRSMRLVIYCGSSNRERGRQVLESVSLHGHATKVDFGGTSVHDQTQRPQVEGIHGRDIIHHLTCLDNECASYLHRDRARLESRRKRYQVGSNGHGSTGGHSHARPKQHP